MLNRQITSRMRVRQGATSSGRPSTVVLKANGYLDKTSISRFRQSLSEALILATDTVIVDFSAVSVVKPNVIRSLIIAMKQAIASGKTLSLEFLDVKTRTLLEEQWHYYTT
jgi:anti-anti-sigma regulatory factor